MIILYLFDEKVRLLRVIFKGVVIIKDFSSFVSWEIAEIFYLFKLF